jgi:phospholipase C
MSYMPTAALSEDKKSFSIKFEAADKAFGKQAIGAPFNVYAPGKHASLHNPQQMEAARNWSYALTAGDSLSDEWALNDFENGQYHLRVYGPNGFYREYKGNAQDPDVTTDVQYQQDAAGKKLTGKIQIALSSGSSKPLVVEIIDNAYKSAPLTRTVYNAARFIPLVLNLQKSHGWYDFSIKVKGHINFEKRYAGRVETGKHSFSDPLMGGVVCSKPTLSFRRTNLVRHARLAICKSAAYLTRFFPSVKR